MIDKMPQLSFITLSLVAYNQLTANHHHQELSTPCRSSKTHRPFLENQNKTVQEGKGVLLSACWQKFSAKPGHLFCEQPATSTNQLEQQGVLSICQSKLQKMSIDIQLHKEEQR